MLFSVAWRLGSACAFAVDAFLWFGLFSSNLLNMTGRLLGVEANQQNHQLANNRWMAGKTLDESNVLGLQLD